MTSIPHDTLLAIMREITKPIGEHLKLRVESPCVAMSEDGYNEGIESILDSRDIVLAVVRYYEGSVSGEDLWHVRQLTDDQLLTLVREAWFTKGDGNATTT